MPPEIQVLENPKMVKVLASETRMKIAKEIIQEPKTLSQLARIFKISPAAVYYHIKQLENVKFVKVVRTAVINNNLVEKYYQATLPQSIVCLNIDTPVKGPVPPKNQSTATTMTLDLSGLSETLSSLGLKCPPEKTGKLEEKVTQLIELTAQQAEANYREILKQLNLKLSPVDRLRVESSIRALVALTLLQVADTAESLKVARSIIQLMEMK